MTKRKKLPIGIQTFREIRENNHYYVDKTALAWSLIDHGKYYFLSRPRRFGKSLFLDTLKELFEGNEPLFQGLAVHPHWNWAVRHPVLRFSFGTKAFSTGQDLENALHTQLSHFEQQFQIDQTFADASGRLSDLLVRLHNKTGQSVVVLVDEYDKPILDALDAPDIAKSNRDFLRGFYGTLKDYDAHIRFALFTGVSKFSKVSLFSGLNNLTDITIEERYSSICGYTDHDIDTVFAPELFGLDRDEIRDWYNGYNWLGEGVYNPFDILQLFYSRKFKNYWFESGTPSFLVNQLFKRQIPTLALDKMFTSETILSGYDVEEITIEALLFQAGYLTIHAHERLGSQDFHTLGYPNLEVRQSLNENILLKLIHDKSRQVTNSAQLYHLLLVNDFAGLKNLFQSFFASIPHHWYARSEIQNYEGYYASVFYSYFASLGLDVVVEDATNLGRIDMVVKFNSHVYLIEFKVQENSGEGAALQQLKDRQYADKYRALNQPIYLIGVEFSRESRNVVGFEVEKETM